jgi:hypothetical protein
MKSSQWLPNNSTPRISGSHGHLFSRNPGHKSIRAGLVRADAETQHSPIWVYLKDGAERSHESLIKGGYPPQSVMLRPHLSLQLYTPN